MRLFVGVELCAEVRQRAGAATEQLRARLQTECPGFSVRWIEPENFHITLWFLGEVHDERVAAVTRALDRPFDEEPFDSSFARLGAFPPRGAPRVLWIGVAEGQRALQSLHQQLTDRLTPLGFRGEERAYSAHLTIGRVKDVPRRCVPAIRAAIEEQDAAIGSCPIERVTLFRSRLSPHCARYEAQLRVPLKR